MITSKQLTQIQKMRDELTQIATSNNWLMSAVISNSIGCNVKAVTQELGIAIHWLLKEINDARLPYETPFTLDDFIGVIAKEANF